MLKVTVEDLGQVVILHANGRIVRGEEAALLCPAVQRRGRDVVLDLSHVDSIDAAGIGALIALQAAGVYVKIANAGRAVREVLRVTGVDSIFEILAAPSTAASIVEDRPANASSACHAGVPATAV